MSEDIMTKLQKAIDEHYEAQWDGGKGSHHPDYEPEAIGEGVIKATRETEELLNAIIKVSAQKSRSQRWGATLNVGRSIQDGKPQCPERHTPLFDVQASIRSKRNVPQCVARYASC